MAEKHPKRPRDLNQWAKYMVDLATGNATDDAIDPSKKVAASAAASKVGLLGPPS
jgi:hypothetical protein